MIATERNTFELYLGLTRRLFAAAARLRSVDALSVGMAWQRWANRVGLWGTPRHQMRRSDVLSAYEDFVDRPAR